MTDPVYLLDANICIYLLRGVSDRLRSRVEQHEPNVVVTSAIAYSEVMIGVVRAGIEEEARRLFRTIPVLPYDQAAGAAYATLPFKRGRLDRLIAGHALVANLTLVTNNERDFADIPRLKIENWTI